MSGNGNSNDVVIRVRGLVNAFNGKVSQRITQKPGDPCTLGISQDGKFVLKGEKLRCSLHLRAKLVTARRARPVQLLAHGLMTAGAVEVEHASW